MRSTALTGTRSSRCCSPFTAGRWRLSPPPVRRRCRKGSSRCSPVSPTSPSTRSEEHTSELQSQSNLVCRLLLEKKKKRDMFTTVGSWAETFRQTVSAATELTTPIVFISGTAQGRLLEQYSTAARLIVSDGVSVG